MGTLFEAERLYEPKAVIVNNTYTELVMQRLRAAFPNGKVPNNNPRKAIIKFILEKHTKRRIIYPSDIDKVNSEMDALNLACGEINWTFDTQSTIVCIKNKTDNILPEKLTNNTRANRSDLKYEIPIKTPVYIKRYLFHCYLMILELLGMKPVFTLGDFRTIYKEKIPDKRESNATNILVKLKKIGIISHDAKEHSYQLVSDIEVRCMEDDDSCKNTVMIEAMHLNPLQAKLLFIARKLFGQNGNKLQLMELANIADSILPSIRQGRECIRELLNKGIFEFFSTNDTKSSTLIISEIGNSIELPIKENDMKMLEKRFNEIYSAPVVVDNFTAKSLVEVQKDQNENLKEVKKMQVVCSEVIEQPRGEIAIRSEGNVPTEKKEDKYPEFSDIELIVKRFVEIRQIMDVRKEVVVKQVLKAFDELDRELVEEILDFMNQTSNTKTQEKLSALGKIITEIGK